jgi:membrane protease YdiL (CAAX protease family)
LLLTAMIESPESKLGLTLWIAGMIGVLAVTFILLPDVLAQHAHRTSRLPLWLVLLIAAAQVGVFLAILVWIGVTFAPRVGLRAPAFQALVTGQPVFEALRPQLLPGILAGLVLAVIPWYLTAHGLIVELHSPRALSVALLYGGITEEIMMRWGLMTLLVWAGWRLHEKSFGHVSAGIVWAAIVISAVIFGAGHLPMTHLLVGPLTASIIATMTGLIAVFGMVAGWLYWRYGLESAILFHASAHLFAYLGHRLAILTG